MRLSLNLCMLLVTFGLFVPHLAKAKGSHTFVIFYEGTIEGDATVIEASINGLFEDLDKTKVNTQILYQNFPQTDAYTIEASVEPISEQAVEYVEDFARAHNTFNIGSVNLSLKRAAGIAEFFSVEGFGPDQSGIKEVSWGTVSRLRQFSSIGAYLSDITELGMSLGRGDKDEIRTKLLPILNPVDAKIFQEWLDGVGPTKIKLSGFHIDSRSFFMMEDGSLVKRLMSWQIDGNLKFRASKIIIK